MRPVGAEALGDHPRSADADAARSGRRSRSGPSTRLASRSPEVSPATIAIGVLIGVGGQRRMPRAAEPRKSPSSRERLGRVRRLVDLPRDRLARLGERQPGPVQRLVRLAQRRDDVGGEAAPLQPFDVDAVRTRRLAADHRERRHVVQHEHVGADHRVRADADELVDADVAAEHDPVADLDVARRAAPCSRRPCGCRRCSRARRARRP